MGEIKTHPVQRRLPRPGERAQCPAVLTMRAYEVYCHIYGEQEAMVTGACRGGFGIGELLCFLYARSFPRAEWADRVEEAGRGMVVGP